MHDHVSAAPIKLARRVTDHVERRLGEFSRGPDPTEEPAVSFEEWDRRLRALKEEVDVLRLAVAACRPGGFPSHDAYRSQKNFLVAKLDEAVARSRAVKGALSRARAECESRFTSDVVVILRPDAAPHELLTAALAALKSLCRRGVPLRPGEQDLIDVIQTHLRRRVSFEIPSYDDR